MAPTAPPAPLVALRSAARYWLMKSEPSEASIDDLARAPNQTLAWTGVRSYQARNFMRDDMAIGDGVLFYHSSCPQSGIAGVARICSAVSPDPTQWDTHSSYYDPKSPPGPGQPRWLQIHVQLAHQTRLLSLQAMRDQTELAGMQVLRRGNRLSITPVTPQEWWLVMGLLGLSTKSTAP